MHRVDAVAADPPGSNERNRSRRLINTNNVKFKIGANLLPRAEITNFVRES